jgi:hypothetical protein
MGRHLAWTFLAFLAAPLLAAPAPADLPRTVTLRARVTAVTPEEPLRIHWRWSGEGLGGNPVRGVLTDYAADPKAAGGKKKADNPDMIVEPTKGGGEVLWQKPNTWSPAVPLSEFKARSHVFITFTLEGQKSKGASAATLRNVVMEFELALGGKTLKCFTEAGPDGPTVGVFLPLNKLGAGPEPTPEFLAEAGGLLSYAQRRQEFLEKLPWANQPLPKLYAFLTDCYGYRTGAGYGIRTTNKDVMLAEMKAVRQLGVNGFRNGPEFAIEMVRTGEGMGKEFARVRDTGGIGYPAPPFRADRPDPSAGCPNHPSRAQWADEVRAEAERIMKDQVRPLPVQDYWLLTVDEIGTIFDRTPERKEHMGCCPHCRKAFHEYLKSFGLGPNDFDAAGWDDLRPTYGYWATTYTDKKAAEAKAAEADEAAVDKADVDVAKAMGKAAGAPAKAAPAKSPAKPVPAAAAPKPNMSEKGWALLTNYSRRFNNDQSARLFTPQKEVFDRENEKKRKAIAAGRLDSPEAKQPWVWSYALRGISFLLGGHSLDYFDFYRQADNGFMYETSNRDPRVWQWDSYACDVGRTLHDRMGKAFGVYVKPHRGAPIQRAVTAITRSSDLIYWYTYGPDWVKGDSFSERPNALMAVSRGVRLIGAVEDVTYGAGWKELPQVALVRPRTSEFFENNLSWENGKWVHSALTHAHIPADALDEGFLESEDLSRYKVIYVSGSHLRRASAVKLAQWVEKGGVLYTSAFGLARDEADQPLKALQPAVGLKTRPDVEIWSDLKRYGATGLPPLTPAKEPPQTMEVAGGELFGGARFAVAAGREALDPAPGTEVLAKFADGKAAATRHAHGKGAVVVIGFYPGVEYAADVMKEGYDMSKDFNAAKRAFVAAPALKAGVLPVVDTSAPLVEGVLLKNPKSGKMAVSLMNWAFRARDPQVAEAPPAISPLDPAQGRYALVPANGLRVTVRGVGPVKTVTSAWSGAKAPFEQKGADIVVSLARLEEADVLVVE